MSKILEYTVIRLINKEKIKILNDSNNIFRNNLYIP